MSRPPPSEVLTTLDAGKADSVTFKSCANLRKAEASALSVEIGTAEPVPGAASTYHFPSLSISGQAERPIKSFTIQFTTSISPGDDIALTATAPFETGGKTGNRYVNAPGGKTISEWQDYLREYLRLTLTDGSTKGLRIVASYKTTSRVLDYNSSNDHYYEAVYGAVTWKDALEGAAGRTYDGRQGYLATVTSQREQDFIETLVSVDCWLGATCDPTYTERYNPVEPSYKADEYVTYYWVCGPEAGQSFTKCLLTTSDPKKKYISYKDPETGIDRYHHWKPGEQPNDDQHQERYLHLWCSDPAYPGYWNDLPMGGLYYIQGYVVEYGGMPDDTPGKGDKADVAVEVDAQVNRDNAAVSVEAEDVLAGEPPRVTDTLNGSPLPDGTIIDHVFEKLVDGLWAPVEGTPSEAGHYRVTSVTDAYIDGTAEFDILPRRIVVEAVFPEGPHKAGVPITTAPSHRLAEGTLMAAHTLESILGTPTYDIGELDTDKPATGIYPITVSFSKLAGLTPNNGVYDLGNYLVTIRSAQTEVRDEADGDTENPGGPENPSDRPATPTPSAPDMSPSLNQPDDLSDTEPSIGVPSSNGTASANGKSRTTIARRLAQTGDALTLALLAAAALSLAACAALLASRRKRRGRS